MTTEMDEDTRLKLIGLKVLATDLNKQSQAIAASVRRLIGETREQGWASDYCWDESLTPEYIWERTAGDREAAK